MLWGTTIHSLGSLCDEKSIFEGLKNCHPNQPLLTHLIFDDSSRKFAQILRIMCGTCLESDQWQTLLQTCQKWDQIAVSAPVVYTVAMRLPGSLPVPQASTWYFRWFFGGQKNWLWFLPHIFRQVSFYVHKLIYKDRPCVLDSFDIIFTSDWCCFLGLKCSLLYYRPRATCT